MNTEYIVSVVNGNGHGSGNVVVSEYRNGHQALAAEPIGQGGRLAGRPVAHNCCSPVTFLRPN